jgi:hypothetical protein
VKPSLEEDVRGICRRKRLAMVAKPYLSASFVSTTGNTLSNGLPIGFTVELCNGFRKEEVFIGRPWTTSDPFGHSTRATKGEASAGEAARAVPNLQTLEDFQIRNSMMSVEVSIM